MLVRKKRIIWSHQAVSLLAIKFLPDFQFRDILSTYLSSVRGYQTSQESDIVFSSLVFSPLTSDTWLHKQLRSSKKCQASPLLTKLGHKYSTEELEFWKIVYVKCHKIPGTMEMSNFICLTEKAPQWEVIIQTSADSLLFISCCCCLYKINFSKDISSVWKDSLNISTHEALMVLECAHTLLFSHYNE